jgi:membrane fusion protein, multidrug efflux system
MNNSSSLKTPIRAGLAALAAGSAALILSACNEPKAQEAPHAAGGPPVTVAAVLEKSIVETHEFSGRLEAVERVEIRPRVAGFIASVNFKPGSEVKKGDLLFVIDPRPYQAEASRAEGAAAAARAKAELAKVEFTRAEKLVAEKAIAQRELDEKASSLKELDAAARAAQASAESARLNLAFTRVQSPINGRVSKAEVTLGNLVDPNAVLTSVVSSNPIYASFDGDEDTYLRVAGPARGGKPAVVRIGLANEAGFPHEGSLEFVDNRVDPATGSVRMRALLKNADNALAPGLFARVQVASGDGNGNGGGTKTALIAERAIGTDQNRKFVFVVNGDGKAEYRQVKLGPVVDGLRVVRDGVKPGEKIVVDGLQRVHAGAPVMAQAVAMDAGSDSERTAKAADTVTAEK